MTQSLHCPLCGSDKVQSGTLQAAGPVCFRPDNARFLKNDIGNIDMTGLLCTQCGNVILLGDIAQITQRAQDSLVT